MCDKNQGGKSRMLLSLPSFKSGAVNNNRVCAGLSNQSPNFDEPFWSINLASGFIALPPLVSNCSDLWN